MAHTARDLPRLFKESGLNLYAGIHPASCGSRFELLGTQASLINCIRSRLLWYPAGGILVSAVFTPFDVIGVLTQLIAFIVTDSDVVRKINSEKVASLYYAKVVMIYLYLAVNNCAASETM
jgi:hypothetical protein